MGTETNTIQKSGKYAQYGKDNLRAYSDQLYRAPGVRAMSVDYSVSQGSYTCRERAAEKLVPDELMNNQDDPYDAKRDAVEVIMDNIWTNQELALSTTMSDSSILTNYTTLSGTSQWSDYDNSTPISDIDTGISTMRTAAAIRPNTAVIPFSVWLKLKSHPDIREQLKYTGVMGNISDDQLTTFLKGYFRLDKVLKGDAVYNSADEGQTDSLADVWGKHFWLTYSNPKPTLMKATFGYTFTDVSRKVDTYREEPKVSDVVRVRYSYDQNIMDANLAYFIENAIA